MPRLIKAEELKHILNNSKYYGTKAGNAFADMITECKTIEGGKKGHWELMYEHFGVHYVCSCCGEWKYHQEQNYCGHCGADMRGDRNDN